MAIQQVLPSVESSARATIKELFDFIIAQGDGDYIGERVSQLQHSLQAATLAKNAGADDETVLGALLHDIGRFIPEGDEMAPMIDPDGTFVGRASHEVVGESYLRQLGFSDKICQLVGAHVIAKRYLTAVDKGYYDGLSQSSKTTLKFQGGPFSREQVLDAERDPLLEAKLAVRRWDDEAKDPEMQTYPLSSFEDMAFKSIVQSRSCFELHGRTYHLSSQPMVFVCVDGVDPEYLKKGIADGIIPNFVRIAGKGDSTTAKSCMEFSTRPNNASTNTGAPPAVHGISSDNFLDREAGEEQVNEDDAPLKGPTTLELMSKRGVRVAAITAEDELREPFAHGLQDAICFSSQNVGECTVSGNGIENVEEWIGRPAPSQKSGDLSLYVMDASIKLLEEDRADLFFLTLSDHIQNKHAPGEKESNDFLSALDQKFGKLVQLGAQIAVTGVHRMSEKGHSNGSSSF